MVPDDNKLGAPLAAPAAASEGNQGPAGTSLAVGTNSHGTMSAPVSDDARGSPAAADQAALVVGERVGRYQVRRLLGQGGMGQVYLARDLMLGRSVAIKVIRPGRLDEHGRARFVREARLLAALNHPNIVTLYDAGLHGDAPYLALEYIEGESLRERARPGSLDEALRLLRDVADALAHAHAAGVLHCDLKPSNLLWGRDGRLRVVDFGLARPQGGGHAGREGTEAWMAPEQWRGEALTDRADLWAFSIVLLELCGAPHPFGPAAGLDRRVCDPTVAPALPEASALPVKLRELVAASLVREPARRPSAATWLAALEDALSGRDAPLAADGPYRGLAAFDEAHALDYFGRGAEVDAFCARLRDVTVLPVVGPSGVGKSSFLHAGVIPRLRAQGTVVIALRPGAAPLTALARRLLATGGASTEPPDEAAVRGLAEALREAPSLLALRLAALVDGPRGVLLAIDQLEELFTHGAPAADVRAMLAMIFAAADDPRENVRVVATIRDDFVGRLAGARELHVLRPLDAEALRQSITKPLHRAGYAFEDERLVDDMLAEVGGATELPLVQFACRALWDERDLARRVLLREVYARLGGVAGALARHADGVLAGMTAPQQGVARRVLLRLVVGGTRRSAPRAGLEHEISDAGAVLDRLVAARLLVSRTSAEGETLVELIHEALITRWDRLAAWLADSQQERRLLAELEDAARRWRRLGQRPEDTWPADEIAAARHRASDLELTLAPELEAFLAAGEAKHRELRRRARRRLVLGAITAAAVTTGSVLAAGAFLRQKLAAERGAKELLLAGTNTGEHVLVLAPFHWGPDGAAVPIDAARVPGLSWRVFAVDPNDEHRPGVELPAALVRRKGAARVGLAVAERVELPGGDAFLRLDGRGSDGESCAPAWIRLRGLPGYAARDRVHTLELAVPTCAASRADLVRIEAGPFVYGGAGAPTTRSYDPATPEELVELPAFSIDRTEVSNARFAPFARMHRVTGYAVPDYPQSPFFADAGAPGYPVSAIDAFTAEAFCRFLGKRLPSEHEWVKAARGGLTLGGAPNPWPRRLYPWGPHPAPCANSDGAADGHAWVAPVDSYPCGHSPYGVANLAGNVAEWISREGQSDRARNPLRMTRGGQVDSPPELDHATTTFRNEREGRHFSYAIGVRCAQGEP